MTITQMQLTHLEALHPDTFRAPAERIASTGSAIAIAGADGSLRFGTRRVEAHRGRVTTLTAVDGLFVSSARDGFSAIWDERGRPLHARHHPTGPITAASLVDGTLIIGDDHGFVFASDLHTGATDWIADVNEPITAITAMSEVVMVGTESGAVYFDGITQKRHRGRVIGLFPLGRYDVVSVGDDGRVRFGEDLLLRVAEGVTACALRGSHLTLAIGRELQEWDLRTLELLRSTTSTTGPVVDLAVDGRGTLALIDGETAPRRWN